MEETLQNILDNEGELSIEKVFDYFTTTNDIFLIKYDGLRSRDKYTCAILGESNRFDAIRGDYASVQEGLRDVLRRYKNVLGK